MEKVQLGRTGQQIKRYGGRYSSESDLSIEDQELASKIGLQALQEEEKREKSSTKNENNEEVKTLNHTTLPYTKNLTLLSPLKEISNEEFVFRLAELLEDLGNFVWYDGLVKKRRRDFLRNCLVITLNAFERGVINKTKGAYFAGVVKQRTALQERLKKYKQKHNHIT